MPNCQWYALPEDHRPILEFVFAEPGVEVWENASNPGEALRCYNDPETVLREFDQNYANGRTFDTVYITLHVTHASDAPVQRVLAGGREHARGLGLIQFHLADARLSRFASWTNHNSEKRAAVWREPGEPNWDFKEITRISSRINRFIRKQAVAKIGSISVMRGIDVCWQTDEGQTCLPKAFADTYRSL